MSGGSYGLHTWASAAVLAQWLWRNKRSIAGKQILELGAGTALPSVVAAKCGARVVISDCVEECLRNAAASCAANRLGSVLVRRIPWGKVTPDLCALPKLDFIIAADCFYDPSVFEDIFFTVAYLIGKNPESVFICSYQERCADWSIQSLLDKWNLFCEELPLKSFEADTASIAGSDLPGSHSIIVFRISKKLSSS